MGYYTNYEIEVHVNTEDRDEFVKEFEDVTEYAVDWIGHTILHGELRDVKWYDHAKDLEKLTAKFPKIVIYVDGVGEDYPDIWRAKAVNGDFEKVKARIEFDAFTI